MAKKQTTLAQKARTSSVSVAEFMKNPADCYAKVQSGQRLVLTGENRSNQIVIYPGTLSDYGSR